jgi:hypothetical protein
LIFTAENAEIAKKIVLRCLRDATSLYDVTS